MNESDNESSSRKRTRISRACDACRRKKIKCDVDSKNPCTTCQQYNWECTFNDTAKKRGPPKGYIESLESRLEKMEELLKNIGSESEGRLGTRQYHVISDEDLNTRRSKVMRYHGSSSGYYLVGNMLQSKQDQDNPQHDPEKLYVLRSFNGKPNYRMRRINVNDDDLVVVRDATPDEVAVQQAEDGQETIDDLIPRPILTALIYTFFRDAHTTLPVIEKKDYLDAFEGRINPPPAPLLTYAICTYACFLLKASDPIFKEAGVERDYVFQTLLERATSLVRKEYLRPRIVTIQALVLLCAHPTYSTSSYRNWILAGMAVRMAQDLGLHRTVTTVESSIKRSERKKQLWYSVYATDRWCCAVMGRPLAIADSDCDVELPLIHGASGDEDLTMFVNFVKLSGILGEILRRIYSPKAKSNGYASKAMEQTVYSLQKMLDEWFLQVPYGYKITEQDLADMKINPNIFPENSKKMIEGGPLTVCYHAIILLLHRPFIVLEQDQVNTPSISRAFDLCRHSAKLAINIARSIPYMAIAKFGWNFAAYSVFQAALIHVYNCTNPNPQIAAEAKEYVKICTEECLGPLSKDIPAGPPLIPFLQTLSNLLQNEQDTHSQPAFQTNTNFLDNLTVESGQSWLLNGNGGNSLPQTTWQQLFSTAGTPFTENSNNQNLDTFCLGNQPNLYM